MKLTKILSIIGILSLITQFSYAGDTGTIKMTFDEFMRMKKNFGEIEIRNATYQKEASEKHLKVKIGFLAFNHAPKEKKIYYMITIFDAQNQIIFSGNDDFSVDPKRTEDSTCDCRIATGTPFEPAMVYFRATWVND